MISMRFFCGALLPAPTIGLVQGRMQQLRNILRRLVHINGNQVRPGMALQIDGKLVRVVKSQAVRTGKGGAYMQVRSRRNS